MWEGTDGGMQTGGDWKCSLPPILEVHSQSAIPLPGAGGGGGGSCSRENFPSAFLMGLPHSCNNKDYGLAAKCSF